MIDQIDSKHSKPACAGSKTATDQELRTAIEQLYFGYRSFTALPDRILERRGLGRVHHRILYFVGRNPHITVNDLLTTLNVSKQALNAPLRQLIEMNLIAIRTAVHDRRVRQLVLTPPGEQLEIQLTGPQMKQLGDIFDKVGRNAEAGWLTVMRNLAGQ